MKCDCPSLTNDDCRLLLQEVGLFRSQAAYRKLFMYFASSVTRFAQSIVQCEEVAEEIYCDVWMKLWDQGPAVLNIENLRFYLFRAIKNACLNHVQKQKRTRTVPLDACHAAYVVTPATTDEQLISHEFLQQASLIINSFSPACAAVFQLVRNDGLTYKETAALLNISVNTVEFHMKNALAKLKAGLAEYISLPKK